MERRHDPERALDALLDEVKKTEHARPTPAPEEVLLRVRERLDGSVSDARSRPHTLSVWSLAAALLIGLCVFLVVDHSLEPADRVEDELVQLLTEIDDLDPSSDGLQALLDQIELENYGSILESPLIEELGSS